MNDSAHFSEWQHRIAVADDQEAFLLLYKYFKKRLEKFAYSICHSKEDAEEIVEDVFVRIWIRRTTLDQILNLKVYLYIATRNFCLNFLKSKSRNSYLDPDNLKTELEDITPNPQQQLLNKEIVEVLNKSVAMLPPKCKAIYKLIKEDGLKHKEVAEILHLSPKTIENQLTIAIKKIVNSINQYELAKEKPKPDMAKSTKNPL